MPQSSWFLQTPSSARADPAKLSRAGGARPSMRWHDGAGRPAQRAAAPFIFHVVETDYASACAHHPRMGAPLTDCWVLRDRVRAGGVAGGSSLRSGTLPRIGELRYIALHHAERSRTPAAAAERRAASTTPTPPCTAAAACGSWRSVGATGRGCWRPVAPWRSALTAPVPGPAMARGTRRWDLRGTIPKGVCQKREILQHARLQRV